MISVVEWVGLVRIVQNVSLILVVLMAIVRSHGNVIVYLAGVVFFVMKVNFLEFSAIKLGNFINYSVKLTFIIFLNRIVVLLGDSERMCK